MVSKIAVIALVVVVATPILLGYGLNITSEDREKWVDDGVTINVSDYLSNIVDASKRNYTNADLYQFNSLYFYKDDFHTYPVYVETTQNKGGVALNQYYFTQPAVFAPAGLPDRFVSFIIPGGYDANNYYRFDITFLDNSTESFDHIKNFFWTSNGTTAAAQIELMGPTGIDAAFDLDNITGIIGYKIGNPPGYYAQWDWVSGDLGWYANISKGYYVNIDYPISQSAASPSSSTYIQPNGICGNMLMTFNLDSITASDYWMGIKFDLGYNYPDYYLELIKTTSDGVAQWSYKVIGDNEPHPLYHNPALSNNTYQLFLDKNTGGEWRYVGAWSGVMAAAVPLITYPFSYLAETHIVDAPRDSLPPIMITGQSPIMRVDTAMVAAYEYKIIRDTTYSPAEFKNNPSTKLSNFSEFGTSIEFGGELYTVDKGNITIGGKSFSLRNMVFESIPLSGRYENTINGIPVSVTDDPAQIRFNGDWAMTVETVAQKTETVHETKWVPGKFAWNGLDTDFKIAGLLGSIVAFIALGVYGRRSGAKVLPLLLVCGGAAFMFLVMI